MKLAPCLAATAGLGLAALLLAPPGARLLRPGLETTLPVALPGLGLDGAQAPSPVAGRGPPPEL